MANTYRRYGLTGGNAGTLDSLDGVALATGDMAIVLSTEGIVYHYKMESASGADENSPLIIAPDTNAVNKRWILCSAVSELFNDLELTSQVAGFTIAGGTSIRTLTVDETAHISGKISHSLATAENDFLIGAPNPFGTFVKKTLTETKAILDYGMFEIDINGGLMPKNTVTSDPYFELDINGAVMPKAV